jgi:hypothetical protein
METLGRLAWNALREEHHRQVDPWIAPRLERRSKNELHPIDDFLFDYYPISAKKLRTWHPGINVQLEADFDDLNYFPENYYEHQDGMIRLSQKWVDEKSERISELHEFLKAVASHAPKFGCFGLHEWAMVLGVDEVRHQLWPLRVTQETIRETITDQGLRCTHFDAFRFFTDEARPLNPLQLVRTDQRDCDQGGCLHANMDLYKYAFELSPILGSKIVRDAFALAKEIRDIDMQAAPYDLKDLGLAPIKIETAQGRLEFAQKQKEFSERAQQIRAFLIERTQDWQRNSVG